ncbi:MAG: SUMF1/EgtB/PvdO family nonheme iron enzyme, partial [Caldilineales bacterium]|nr:SUMF1/EgtB/PvdO family nonheme iron enzyme [Caldilineales bacterium]
RLAVIRDAGGRGCARMDGPGKNETPARFAHTGNTWDVGSRPAGRYGLFDMAGNAQEWVSDWFAPTLARCGSGCIGHDPKGPCQGADKCAPFRLKLVKGGAWYWGPISARAAARRPHVPHNRPPHHFGFRCARDLDS